MIRAAELDAFVFDQMREILLRPDVLLAGEQALVSREPAPDDEILDAQLARLTRRVEEATAERRRITDLYQAGHIDMKELNRRATEVDARRGQLETEQTELTAQRHELAIGNRLRQRVTNFAKQAADGIDTLDFDQRQRLLRLTVEQVRVHGWQVELRLRIPLDAAAEDNHHPKAPDHHDARQRGGLSSKDRLRSLGAHDARTAVGGAAGIHGPERAGAWQGHRGKRGLFHARAGGDHRPLDRDRLSAPPA